MANKRLHLTIASVTSCADAQAAPATLAGEANVIQKRDPMSAYLFDTNVLNDLLDRTADSAVFPAGIRCCVTSGQIGELKNTKNQARRAELLSHFEELQAGVPVANAKLHSAPFGNAPFGSAPFGGGDGEYFEAIKRALDGVEGNRSKRGNSIDALTLEACIYAKAVLVTNDPSLAQVAQQYRVQVLEAAQFFERHLNLR